MTAEDDFWMKAEDTESRQETAEDVLKWEREEKLRKNYSEWKGKEE